MSQTPPTQPPPLTVPVQEAGWVFRLEMMFSNLALGYFRHVLVVVAVGLVAVLVYGQYTSWQRSSQREAAAAVSAVRVELRDALFAGLDPQVAAAAKRAGYGLGETFQVIGQLPEDQQRALMMTSPELIGVQELLGALPPQARDELFASEDDLTSALLFVGVPNDGEKKLLVDHATRLVGVADGYSGVGAGLAYLEAADWYARGGDAAGRRAALDKALATGVGDPIRSAAVIGLAAVELDAGQGDAAAARLKELAATAEGFFQEQAAYELALTLELAGKTDEAKVAWADFVTKHPASDRAEDARRREKRLGGGAATEEGPIVAPAGQGTPTEAPVGP